MVSQTIFSLTLSTSMYLETVIRPTLCVPMCVWWDADITYFLLDKNLILVVLNGSWQHFYYIIPSLLYISSLCIVKFDHFRGHSYQLTKWDRCTLLQWTHCSNPSCIHMIESCMRSKETDLWMFVNVAIWDSQLSACLKPSAMASQ